MLTTKYDYALGLCLRYLKIFKSDLTWPLQTKCVHGDYYTLRIFTIEIECSYSSLCFYEINSKKL